MSGQKQTIGLDDFGGLAFARCGTCGESRRRNDLFEQGEGLLFCGACLYRARNGQPEPAGVIEPPAELTEQNARARRAVRAQRGELV